MNVFKKYLKKEDPEKSHAKLSASGSERWLNCAASIRLSKGVITTTSAASERGTNTHTLLQFILENKEWKRLLTTVEGVMFRIAIGYDVGMLSNALFAANYVWSEQTKLERHLEKPTPIHTEKKVKLEGVGFGTSDVIIHNPYHELHVMDYKNGVKAVEPVRNTQGLYYAVAAADLFNWEFSTVKITIIQPNTPHKDGHIRTWETDERELIRASKMFKAGAEKTKDPNAPIVPGAWCWFCPARPTCPAHQETKVKKLMERFYE